MGPDLGRRLTAEFVGTAMLIFFGAGTAVATAAELGALPIALAHGLTLMVVAYAFGGISGGHINPMVTTVLAVTGRFPRSEVLPYVGAQLLGGIVGAFAILASHGADAVTTNNLGSTELAEGVGWLGGATAEALGAFILVLAIHALAVDTRAPGMIAGMGIGLSLTVAILTVGPLTGASLNPARTLGPYVVKAVYGESPPWDQLLLYIIGPIVGGLVAALAYNYAARPPVIPTADEPSAQRPGQVVGDSPAAARKRAQTGKRKRR